MKTVFEWEQDSCWVVVRSNELGADPKLLEDIARASFPASRFRPHPPEEPQGAIAWAESRRCLLEALRLSGRPSTDLFASLSHSRLASAACVSPRSGPVLGIGIDLEDVRREISSAARERFQLSEFESASLSPLELWCLKEACFKSDPRNEGSLISRYELLSFDGSTGRGLVRRIDDSGMDFRVRLTTCQDHLLAIATCLQS